MVKFLYTFIFIAIFSTAVFAQQSSTTSPGVGGNKPVIDNISGFQVNTGGVDGLLILNLNNSNSSSATPSNNSKTPKSAELAQANRNEETASNVKKNMRFFPNPASSNLNIDLGQSAMVEITLINIIGQEVYHTSGEMQRVSINVSNLPQGSYFLSVKIGKENIVRRIEIAK